MNTSLPLRDVHLPPEPPLWPLPVGWWLVIAGLLLLIAVPIVVAFVRARRRRRWRREFEDQLAAAGDASARLVALVGLLRRAARQRQPGSELLQGQAWLQHVDPAQTLPPGSRALLLEGAYRRHVEATELASLQAWAAGRFITLREGRQP